MISRSCSWLGRGLAASAALLALAVPSLAIAQPKPQETTATPAKPASPDAPPAAKGTNGEATKEDLQKQVADQEKRTADLETRLQSAEESLIQTEARQEESKIRLYGFSEFGFRKSFINDKSFFKNIQEDSATFLLGSTNLYLEAQPHPKFRSLNEVRFTLYPNGVPGPDLKQSQTATVFDVTSSTGRNKVSWSGIVLERAILEWKQSDALKVQAGYFLTPYGIWNVDHGSPTLISSLLPSFYASEYFPTRLTGIQLLGGVTTGDWELGYRAYITNGRGRVVWDNQDNKLFGARLYATWRPTWGTVTLGGSGFTGTYVDKDYAIKFEAADPYATFHVEANKRIEYAEWGAAADLALDAGPLRIRSEWVSNRTDFSNPTTTTLRQQTSIPGAYFPDRFRWNVYGLIAYRLPFLGLEPYFYYEYDHRPDFTSVASTIFSEGLNIYLTASARIKLQYNRVLLIDTPNNTKANDFSLFDARFVVAY